MQVDGTAIEREVIIVGTGFSGLAMAIALLRTGVRNFLVLERAHEVGGTWRDNHYPGAACDIPSHLYSYSFEGKPDWSRKYPRQPEIKAYMQHTARKYRVLDHIRFGTTFRGARFDAAAGKWHVDCGERQFRCRFLVLGTGGLSEPAIPTLPGAATFAGPAFHSAAWDHTVALDGKRVAVIGTGASAIQFVPQIAPRVKQLDVYQRTPPWIVPRDDRPFTALEKFTFAALPFVRKLYRELIFWHNEYQGIGIFKPHLMKSAEALARRHIESQISDPALREQVTPRYAMGCKRILISNDWYPALARPNVSVVSSAIGSVGANAITTADGVARPADVIICGTGFQATALLQNADIVGPGGVALKERWAAGGEAYLGTSIKGFPNLFTITGPNTGLGHNSMIYMIETNVNQILETILVARRRNARRVEVKPEVHDRYNSELQRDLTGTVWQSGCRSWYQTDSGKITTMWPGYCFQFGRRARHFRSGDYIVE
ncbi:NAD(P)/FAD-dependent oxidoreductase [Bradyrhizobium sp. U87765 SZCCT0131]|uniref:flavin-containing monooxygenase n=1 Tax=unclassified Bradyrhizobium TaxID=2631580 RepID=UPI001BA8E97D|nr:MULTISPECIES: NAD(P)/FAD-dependent oxidoreductase [unclassified Bradyrhizobium]MBR1221289.1 NAD(P)/FAD-dependent oxidoreductase [Bradyrhizobium sp. U87765 SZCCT0131]MBR1264788.1 NAD(P)/FAD-dependent oxidoreductase [Bradyrhizobium sp. U87765 SZCCT0134]MBR1304306.1 NAD(P)/FAD-dependent oxidoreductase [Bradyrhizobium sp. U87765 SZCCT0110]MBR1322837.1 NAD(P)/FAD-dependent oxidoreductase [Bradyrhizobium sp. U87765 SZCCT0109]MBR1346235.1 NAD(P)/FAD-dependent oxidoreductase [Bradyrhizobium sp. U87